MSYIHPLPRDDNQKCLQALPATVQGVKLPSMRGQVTEQCRPSLSPSSHGALAWVQKPLHHQGCEWACRASSHTAGTQREVSMTAQPRLCGAKRPCAPKQEQGRGG